MPKVPKPPKQTPLDIPPANSHINEWLIFGLDPSMSRTGFALMKVRLAQKGEEAPDLYREIQPLVQRQFAALINEGATSLREETVQLQNKISKSEIRAGHDFVAYRTLLLARKENLLRKLAGFWRDAIVSRYGRLEAQNVTHIMKELEEARAPWGAHISHVLGGFKQRWNFMEIPHDQAIELGLNKIVGQINSELDIERLKTNLEMARLAADISHNDGPPPRLVTDATWLAAGSVKPDKIENAALHPRTTLWIRGKAMALYLREFLKHNAPKPWGQESDGEMPGGLCCQRATGQYCYEHDPANAKPTTGLIISMEYPTPMNDYLVALNRIIHLIFFEEPTLAQAFGEIRILTTNASTLRSLMRLTKKGSQNKGENIERAYEFINRGEFPELDSDACDAVLLGMVGRHAASILLGCADELPPNFLNSLCNATQEIKGSGRNAHAVTKGLLHRNEYWYRYELTGYTVCVKDASNPKKALNRVSFSI